MVVKKINQTADNRLADNLNDEDEELLTSIEELATGYQAQYGGCGQAIVHAIGLKMKIPGTSMGIKASSFAGLGVARMGDFCGALFGAFVALGLASGREKFTDPPYPEPKLIDEETGNPKSMETIRTFFPSK